MGQLGSIRFFLIDNKYSRMAKSMHSQHVMLCSWFIVLANGTKKEGVFWHFNSSPRMKPKSIYAQNILQKLCKITWPNYTK